MKFSTIFEAPSSGTTYCSIIIGCVSSRVSKVSPVGAAKSLALLVVLQWMNAYTSPTYHVHVEDSNSGCKVVLVEDTLEFVVDESRTLLKSPSTERIKCTALELYDVLALNAKDGLKGRLPQ
jgi:hypothetical protein